GGSVARVAADELGGRMGRVRRAAAVAEQEQLMAVAVRAHDRDGDLGHHGGDVALHEPFSRVGVVAEAPAHRLLECRRAHSLMLQVSSPLDSNANSVTVPPSFASASAT